jgi:hypothetical protein
MIGKNVGKDTSKAVTASVAARKGKPRNDTPEQKIIRSERMKKKVKCIHCDTWNNVGNIAQHHNNNCKSLLDTD